MDAGGYASELARLASDFVCDCLMCGDEQVSVADFARRYLNTDLSDVDAAGVARLRAALETATIPVCPECHGDRRAFDDLGHWVRCWECEGTGSMFERPAVVMHALIEDDDYTATDVAAE